MCCKTYLNCTNKTSNIANIECFKQKQSKIIKYYDLK